MTDEMKAAQIAAAAVIAQCQMEALKSAENRSIRQGWNPPDSADQFLDIADTLRKTVEAISAL